MSDVYLRPIRSRYLDPIDVIWFSTARRLGLTIRRNPAIFSATDGTGLLELGPRDTLDEDDSAAQMIFHEICHWATNGVETFHVRDWGFALDAELDWREHACLRLQAAWTQAFGLREVLAPTSGFREYYDAIPADAFVPLDASPREADVVALARVAYARSREAPFGETVAAALRATAAVHTVVHPFLSDYATDLQDDPLPSLWSR